MTKNPAPRREPVDVASLTEADRAELTRRMGGLLDRALVAALLDVTGLTLHLVELHLSDEGEVVAWVLGQLIELDGGRTGVLRVEMAGPTGIHGRLFSPDSALLRRVQAWQAGAGERTLQLLTLCSDPGTYNLVTRQLRTPSSNWSTPLAAAQDIAAVQAADALGLDRVRDDDPLVRRVQATARQLGPADRYWQRLESPAAHYFQVRVPDAYKGHGLVVLSPLSPADLTRPLSRLARWVLGHGPITAEQKPEERGRVRTLPAAQAATSLRSVPLLEGVAPEVLDHLAGEAIAVHVSAGQAVVVAGQPAEGMYVITEGAVEVGLPDTSGSEMLVDILGEGDVFGEIGLVVGGTCTATVRAHEAATLLRVGRETYERTVAEHPELAEALWQAAGRRLLTNRLLDDRDQADIDACIRSARSAALIVLHEPEPMLPGHYFVVRGEGRVDVTETWFTVADGALFRLTGPGALTPRSGPLRVLAYPPPE